MRRLMRAATVAGAATGAVLAGALPAHADGEWLRVNPTTIQAGFSVTIEASCGTNVNPAKVQSDAFGEQVLLPQNNSNFLFAVLTVPGATKPKGYQVTLTCATGGKATSTLWVIGMPTPTKGPNTGGGALANGLGSGGPGGGSLLLAGGLTALAAGAGFGFVALRKHRPRRRLTT